MLELFLSFGYLTVSGVVAFKPETVCPSIHNCDTLLVSVICARKLMILDLVYHHTLILTKQCQLNVVCMYIITNNMHKIHNVCLYN